MAESVLSASGTSLTRLISQAATAAPWSTSSPRNVEAEIAAAMSWNYLVQLDHDWDPQDELCFTVTYNEHSSADESGVLTDQISDTFHLCIHSDQMTSDTRIRLIGKTIDGGNPQYWPTVRLKGCEPWIPDRSNALQPDPSEGWQVEHIQFGGMELEWVGLDVRERRSAMFSIQVPRSVTPSQDIVNPPKGKLGSDTVDVRFFSPIVPLIQREIEPIDPSDTLHQTIEQLLRPMRGFSGDTRFSLRIRVSYEYALNGLDLLVPIPVLLADNNSIGKPDTFPASLARELAGEICKWREGANHSTLKSRLNFSLTVFCTGNERSMPLVDFRSIPISVSNVAPSWWS